MIARDRELLAYLARVNRHLGEVTVYLMAHQDDGELPVEGLRELGERLSTLAGALVARALESRAIAPQDPSDDDDAWCVVNGMRHYITHRDTARVLLGCGDEIPLGQLGGEKIAVCIDCVNHSAVRHW